VAHVCACGVPGMNFLAGFLLGWMDEERCFWTLCNLVEDLLPAYFSKGKSPAFFLPLLPDSTFFL